MNEIINLSFTLPELKVLDAGLSELPYKISAPVIQSINQQLSKVQPTKPDK